MNKKEFKDHYNPNHLDVSRGKDRAFINFDARDESNGQWVKINLGLEQAKALVNHLNKLIG